MSRAVEGTETRGQEHQRGQVIGWDQGRCAAGVACVSVKTKEEKKKKKKGRRSKDLFGLLPEERSRFIPVAPAVAQQRDLGVNQADKTTPRSIPCVGEAFEDLRLKEGERDEEGARTGRGNGDGVGAVRCSRAAHPC